MDGRVYKIPIIAVASPAAAFDAWEVNVASGKLVEIAEINIGQSSDYGDAQAEGLYLSIISGYSSSGTGGSTPTARAQPGDSAYSGTVETMNTTVATGGSPVDEFGASFNEQGAFWYFPEERHRVVLVGGARGVIRISGPADAITITGTLVIVEKG